MPATASLAACPCCGLVQTLPDMPTDGRRRRLRCRRCRTSLVHSHRSNQATAALALSALVLLPLAVSLPVFAVSRFGHLAETSIWNGAVSLVADGQLFVGAVVLLCSVILPLLKLVALFVLSGGGPGMGHRMRAWTWHMVEWTGRWGMLDVLLVAILVAALKLGDMVTISAGPGAWAFTVCVLLNLLASALFDPHDLWEQER